MKSTPLILALLGLFIGGCSQEESLRQTKKISADEADMVADDFGEGFDDLINP